MTVPYPMLKFGRFMRTVRSGKAVYGCGLRTKWQNFAKNKQFFVIRFTIMESIVDGQLIWP